MAGIIAIVVATLWTAFVVETIIESARAFGGSILFLGRTLLTPGIRPGILILCGLAATAGLGLDGRALVRARPPARAADGRGARRALPGDDGSGGGRCRSRRAPFLACRRAPNVDGQPDPAPGRDHRGDGARPPADVGASSALPGLQTIVDRAAGSIDPVAGDRGRAGAAAIADVRRPTRPASSCRWLFVACRFRSCSEDPPVRRSRARLPHRYRDANGSDPGRAHTTADMGARHRTSPTDPISISI